MAFRKKYQKVMDLKPDLLVLQECENELKLKDDLSSLNYNQLIWYGKNPNKGVAVIAFNEVNIEFNEDHDESIEYVVPIKLYVKDRDINLSAIWAMPHRESRARSYVVEIWAAINYYSDLFEKDSMLIGDFNSNAIWDHKRKVGNHTELISFLNTKNIYSVYHQLTNSEHGAEKHPTLYLTKNEAKPYHMDYCCASHSLFGEDTTIEIGRYDEWIELSDHMPVIIDHIG